MGTCESCGRSGENLERVQRIYLLPLPPGEGERPGDVTEEDVVPTAGDIEWWCASCAATFPHVPVPVEQEDPEVE